MHLLLHVSFRAINKVYVRVKGVYSVPVPVIYDDFVVFELFSFSPFKPVVVKAFISPVVVEMWFLL